MTLVKEIEEISYANKVRAWGKLVEKDDVTALIRAFSAKLEGEEMRKEFEADCVKNDVYIARHHKMPEQYQLYETQLRWMGWQAALALVREAVGG